MEIVQHNMENQKSVLRHFLLDVEMEHPSTQITVWFGVLCLLSGRR
jgi:hypothetical protein